MSRVRGVRKVARSSEAPRLFRNLDGELDAGTAELTNAHELTLEHVSPDVVRAARELLEAVLEGAGGRELEERARAFRFACAGVTP